MSVTVTKIKPAFSDDRGAIIDVLEAEVHHTGIITFSGDAVRANHYHKKQTQYTYITMGKVELKTKDAKNPDAPVEKFLLEPGDLATIPPFTIHAYRALEPTSMLCLTTLPRSSELYEEDTFRVEPL